MRTSDLIDRQALLDECLNHYEVGNIEQNCTVEVLTDEYGRESKGWSKDNDRR